MELCFEDVAVFWDWMSLYQEHGGPGRTKEQQGVFKKALTETMDLWYSHQMIAVLFVTVFPEGYGDVRPYGERGWPSFERRSSQLIKRAKSFGLTGWCMCTDLAAHQGSHDTPRQVPFAPVTFDGILQQRVFTNGADREVVSNLYQKVATAVLGATSEIVYDQIK
eukprot:4361798-Prymnesium_polylepis.1